MSYHHKLMATAEVMAYQQILSFLPTFALLLCFEDHSYKTSSFKWARPASHYTEVDQLPGHRSAQGKSHCVAYITQRGIPSRKTYVCSLNDKDNFSPGFYISSLHLPLYVKVRWRNLLFTCALCSSLAAEKVSEKLFYFNWLFSKQQEKGQCKQRLYRRNKWKINILK